MALSLIISTKTTAQKNPANEAQLKKQANNFFEDENYAKAYLQYSQLLSLYPQDPNYNYRFGACILFSQSDKKKAVDYIETALKQPSVDNLAYYYMGRAYHLNYRFDDAIKAYQHFKQNASGSDIKKHPVDRLIEMCTNGKHLLGNLHDLDVLRKKELNMTDYYEAYDLSSNGGTLLVEPEDFKTKVDKKKGLTSIIYLSSDRTQLFFASYGDDDKNGKDIYMAYRLPNGAWGKPANLGTTINTQYDEDYPFYDAPTHTLYFCSMGHNSMGGYDIFRSQYSEISNSWSAPVNMNFPINTPGDDILFIADTMNETAFFSSTRSSPDGRIAVYKIVVQPHPPDYLVVKGTTYNDAGSALAASRITVKNSQTNEVIGVFSSTADNGNYVMNLANGGHFVYTVETPNHKTQSESVTLPLQNEITPLQQQISYEATTDRLIVKNISEGAVSDSNYLLAMDVIQKNAIMDVNIDTTQPRKTYTPIATATNPNNSTNPTNSNNPVITSNNPQSNNPANPTTDTSAGNEVDSSSDIAIDTTGKRGISSNQIEQIAINDVKQRQTEAKSEKEDANRDIEYAANKLTESQQLARQSKQLTALADNLTDPKQKNDTLAKAAQLKQQSDEIGKKAMEAFQLASQQEIQAIAKQKEADHAASYVASLDSALKSPNKEKAIKKLQAQHDSIEKQDENNLPTTPTAGDLIRLQAQNAKQDSVEVVKHNVDLQKEADNLQLESDNYVAQAQKTDNANEKVALLAQARDLASSKKEKENEITENQKTLTQLHDQYNDLIVQAKQIDSTTKSNPQSQQIPGADAISLKEDIKNFNPSQSNPNNGGNNPDTSHHAQPGNIVAGNNSQNNSAQNNPSNITDTSHHAQPGNVVASNNPQNNSTQNNPTNITDSNHHVQPGNVVASNNPQNNSTQNNPNNATDTNHTSQPGNVVASNNPQTNPNQNNPGNVTDTSHNAQPGNTAANNYVQNPLINYSSPQASQSTKSAIDFNKDAVVLSNRATDVRNQAKQATDPSQAKALYHKADSLDDASQEQRIVSSIYVNTADSAQYKANQQQLGAWQTAVKNNISDSVTLAQSVLLDAKGNYTQSVLERQKADNTTVPFQKQLHLDNARQFVEIAISKQQQAHDILLRANPDLKNVTPSNVIDTSASQPGNPIANNNPQTNPTQNNPGNNIASNNPQTNPTQTNPGNVADTNHHTQPGNAIASNNPQTNPTQNNPSNATDTSHNTQPGNIVASNNPQTNPTQNNPNNVTDTSHNTLPGNIVANNNPQTNPTQNHPSNVIDTSHNTLPGNAVANNNPRTNPNANTDGGHNTQPNNQVVSNNPQTNPTQNNQNANTDGGHTTQPNNQVASNNPQTNPNANTDGGHNTQPANNAIASHQQQNSTDLVNFPELGTSVKIDEIKESPRSPYSNKHPIPINPPLPEGLIYKVQIGAFKKPISQTAFKGLEPISGETTGKGLTRYTAGVFKDLGKANNAQSRVRSIGYKDAFVVAFYNGKRISIKNAASLQNSTPPVQSNTPPVATNNQPTNTNTPVQQPGNTAVSIPVNQVKGLFFTVQVGAYKTTVTSDKLYNLSPLFSSNAANGFIRYNCGIYSDVTKASAAKDAIVGKTPIKDAFVTAYYNGERIPLAKAKELLSNKSATISENSDLDKTPAGSNTNPPNPTPAPIPAPAAATHLDKAILDTTPFPEGSIFTVQIADFSGQLSGDMEGKVLGIAMQKGITVHKKNDRTVYTVGKYEEYKSADSLKALIITTIAEATVVEYINDQPMSYNGGAPTPTTKRNGRNNAHGTNTTPPVNANHDNSPTQIQPTTTTLSPTTNNTASNDATPSNTASGKVIFCVQVGAYSGQIPINVANSLLKVANQGVTTHQEGAGITSYTLGSYSNYASAKTLKEELVQDGFPGCFVVAYHNGKKISLQEAQSQTNK